ncbi:SusC/RagA family TonB-linked outer membrane protein [Chitinophaga sp. 212800010-3]|uniref:SusC/RagA family TonB-linked outer membrane protein n=1 Tax=unclassified Chitinophaga TaxID=2619133 RepID=UPI002DE79F90|nr:Iron complex outermembrane recepter protein [Chitinophaga sp. 212800010-3]
MQSNCHAGTFRMRKKVPQLFSRLLAFKKTVAFKKQLIMQLKITTVLMTVLCMQISAKTLSQQITLNQRNAPIQKVFEEIKKQSGYRFWYEDAVLQKSKPVDISVRNASLEEVLTLLFRNQPFSYEIIGKIIAVKDKDVTLENAPPLMVVATVVNRRITGIVKDSSGAPVPGVSYAIKGTKTGGATNVDGRFSIEVPDGPVVLVFSSIGFEPKTVTVAAGTNNISVVMNPASSGLNEMVVTALGIKRPRGTLGYAISTIKGDELTKAGTTMNPFLALYGKAAGVGVNVGAAGPAGGIRINIRGAASMNAQQNVRPLFVVDGVILNDRKTQIGGDIGQGFDYGAGINDINPDDIESMDILKGAKATVLYGSDAANGVVLITTKTGKNASGFGMTANLQHTWEQPVSYLKLQDKYGLGDNLYDTSYATINGVRTRLLPNKRFSFGPAFDGANVMFYDSSVVKNSPHPGNFMSMFQTGQSTSANVAIAGSNEKGSIRASYTNYNYTDITTNNAWQRRNTFSFNGNIRASKLASFELVSNIYNITTQNRRGRNDGPVAWGYPVDFDYGKIFPYYTDATGYKRDLTNAGVSEAFSQLGSYLWDRSKNAYKDDKIHMITSAKVTLNFTDNISLVGQAGLDYDNTNYDTRISVTRVLPTVNGGSFGVAKENATTQTYQALLHYNKSFLNNDLRLYAFAGGSYRLRTVDYLGTATVGGLNFPNWYSFSNQLGTPNADNAYLLRNYSRGNDVLYSMLASAALSWKNELTLELQGRQDWNSTLPPENNKYFYPGTALTWNYTERFPIPGVNSGQLRLSWADVGNGTVRYYANNLYDYTHLPNTNASTVSPPDKLLPGALKPERKREFEVGINNSFLPQDRITLDFSFYTNHRYNQIIGLPISSASSSTGLTINVGDVKAWGFELALTGSPVVTKNFRWTLTWNAASQGSRVEKLYPGVKLNKVSDLINGSAAAIHSDEGRPYGEIVMQDFQRDPSGNKVVNGDGLYVLDDKKTVVAGNVMPKVYGGFISDFRYKDLSFRIGFDYKFGGTIFSYTNNRLTGTGQLASTLKYRDEANGGLAYYIDASGNKVPWQHSQPAPAQSRDGKVYHDGLILPGVKADGSAYKQNDIITSATAYYESYVNDLATSFPPDRVEKNNYIKLRELALGYTLPARITKMLRLQRATITAAARNLFYIYKSIPNIDPEGALGADVYVENTIYPSQRTYSLGLNVAF